MYDICCVAYGVTSDRVDIVVCLNLVLHVPYQCLFGSYTFLMGSTGKIRRRKNDPKVNHTCYTVHIQ